MNFVSPAGTRVVYPHVESKPKYIETVLFKRPARREDVIIRDEGTFKLLFYSSYHQSNSLYTDQPPSKGLYSLSPVQKTNLNHTPVHAQHTHQSHPIPSITLTSKNHTVIIYGFPSNLTNESLQKFKQIGHCTATLIPSRKHE